MTDMIMNILQWAIPSGGIGAAIAWIANRKVKEAEQAKRIHMSLIHISEPTRPY